MEGRSVVGECTQEDGPGNGKEILMFMHCSQCLAEKPPHISAQDWSRLDAGWTRRGFQVWCMRHDCNVIHVDFEGKKHPANCTRRAT